MPICMGGVQYQITNYKNAEVGTQVEYIPGGLLFEAQDPHGSRWLCYHVLV